MAILRFLHPKWSDTKIHLTAWWNLFKEPVHLLLDLGGLIPVVGEAADLINGAIYLMEGDNLNAGISFAATIPFAGWAATGSKYAARVITNAAGEKALQVIAKGADDIAELAIKAGEKVAPATLNNIASATQRGVTGQITREVASTKLAAEMVEEMKDEIVDAAAKKGFRLTWPEVIPFLF